MPHCTETPQKKETDKNFEKQMLFKKVTEMCEQEYFFKMDKLDEETKERFTKMFNNIYVQFRGLSYSKAELFLEDLKRTLKKDATISGQGWEEVPTV